MSNRITLEDTVMSAMVKIADGNPGAVTALVEMAKTVDQVDPVSTLGILGPLMTLDSLGIYGSNAYVLWNDVCSRDSRLLIDLLRRYQLGFVRETTMVRLSRGESTIDVQDVLAQVKTELSEFN